MNANDLACDSSQRNEHVHTNREFSVATEQLSCCVLVSVHFLNIHFIYMKRNTLRICILAARVVFFIYILRISTENQINIALLLVSHLIEKATSNAAMNRLPVQQYSR